MSLLPHKSKVMSVSVCLGDRWWVLMGRIGEIEVLLSRLHQHFYKNADRA